jgi:hypothetical protein
VRWHHRGQAGTTARRPVYVGCPKTTVPVAVAIVLEYRTSTFLRLGDEDNTIWIRPVQRSVRWISVLGEGIDLDNVSKRVGIGYVGDPAVSLLTFFSSTQRKGGAVQAWYASHTPQVLALTRLIFSVVRGENSTVHVSAFSSMWRGMCPTVS